MERLNSKRKEDRRQAEEKKKKKNDEQLACLISSYALNIFNSRIPFGSNESPFLISPNAKQPVIGPRSRSRSRSRFLSYLVLALPHLAGHQAVRICSTPEEYC